MMNTYRLIMESFNDRNQQSLKTISGEDGSPEDFLERCYQLEEEDRTDPNLIVIIEQPSDFDDAKTFVGGGWELMENDIEITSTIGQSWPW